MTCFADAEDDSEQAPNETCRDAVALAIMTDR